MSSILRVGKELFESKKQNFKGNYDALVKRARPFYIQILFEEKILENIRKNQQKKWEIAWFLERKKFLKKKRLHMIRSVPKAVTF